MIYLIVCLDFLPKVRRTKKIETPLKVSGISFIALGFTSVHLVFGVTVVSPTIFGVLVFADVNPETLALPQKIWCARRDLNLRPLDS
jgi:hypothetical protein